LDTIRVQHALGEYPVHIGAGVLGQLLDWTNRYLPNRRVAILTDTTVERHYAEWQSVADHSWRQDTSDETEPSAVGRVFAVAPGESSKTQENWARLIDALLEGGYGRDSAIIALGGGVVGDLAGFVAATFMRGVPLLVVPTTLVAMVDASVGGKTGINSAHGKNLIGAFHPPVGVIADPRTLLTLQDSTFRGGLAEAVKHGMIADEEYFEWLGTEAGKVLARDLPTLTHLVRRSVELKASIVSRDERESGERAILNAGHTLGHALEHASAYRLDHGEAVALGLLAESKIAEAMGVAEEGLVDRLGQVLRVLHLPTTLRFPVDAEEVVRVAQIDKKTRGQVVRLALPEAIGRMHRSGGEWTIESPPNSILVNVLESLASSSE
jgi:3-dehydroquinate synthase